MIFDPQNMPLGQIVTAIGGLGTAAFGLVDAAKSVFGGINRIGLKHIQDTVTDLTPDQTGKGLPAGPLNALPRKNILETIKANWVNGTDLASQKAIAKSLIKLHPESDVFSRFDLIVTALLDEAYQLSDQVYRNGTRALAAGVAVLLAVVGGCSLEGVKFWNPGDVTLAVLVGLLATPLAPIAKDLSSALATAVNTMQLVKKSRA